MQIERPGQRPQTITRTAQEAEEFSHRLGLDRALLREHSHQLLVVQLPIHIITAVEERSTAEWNVDGMNARSAWALTLEN